MSRRALAVPLAACVALAAAALAAVAGADRRDLAFTPSIRTVRVVATLEPGAHACQRWVEREASFDVVELDHVSPSGRGGELRAAVHETDGGRVLARGSARPRRPAGPVRIRVAPPVPEGTPIDVCVTNAGPGAVGLLGGRGYDSDPSFGDIPSSRSGPHRSDMAVVFRRSEPRSALSQLPDVFERAAVFRPGGAWLCWVLLAGLLVVVPGLLWHALRRAAG